MSSSSAFCNSFIPWTIFSKISLLSVDYSFDTFIKIVVFYFRSMKMLQYKAKVFDELVLGGKGFDCD